MKLKIQSVVVIISLFLGTSLLAQEVEVREVIGHGENVFSLATGSPGELGLVQVLGKKFGEKENAKLEWVKAGSGASLQLLKDQKVDMVMVHAPEAEKQAVADGWAKKRTLIGSNEFYIVGPAADPAGIAQANTAQEAYQLIANVEARFLSRSDNSGTHKKEMFIWDQAGVVPSGDWYIETNDFMAATLLRADKEGGYFMTDSSTWVAKRQHTPNLEILFSGDKVLVNTYHALSQADEENLRINTADKFIDFVASEQGQETIRTYGEELYGDPMYNDAEYASQFIR